MQLRLQLLRHRNTADTPAFNRIADRMDPIAGFVSRSNVTIRYDNSGLGYAGDPNGADVSPIVTVTAAGVPFDPPFSCF